MIEPTDPTKPSPAQEPKVSLPEEEASELASRVNQLLMNMVIGTNPTNPKETRRLQRSATLLSTILWITKSWHLDPNTNKAAVEELIQLTSNMKWSDVERTVRKVVDLIITTDHRVEIIELLMELEHYFCIKPPENQEPMDSETFQTTIEPLLNHLQFDMTPFEIKQITNAARSIRNRYLTNPSQRDALFKELTDLANTYKKD